MGEESGGLYLLHISMHGLVHGTNMELGRDSDTGGQVKYVVELARSLIRHQDVESVDLITRKVVDPRVSTDYAREMEKLEEGVNIIRLPCGPNRYLRKEALWPYMINFADSIVEYLRESGRMPDFLHGHYADAGFVCSRVSALTGVPMAFTGHSLGKGKEEDLIKQGWSGERIEKQFNIKKRIEAEEVALENASFVVASTGQEAEEQYKRYSNFVPTRMIVISPGVDLSKFKPPARSTVRRLNNSYGIEKSINRFLHDSRKPAILALSRPDAKKNVINLLKAYGENEELRNMANLILVLGTRDDIKKMEKSKREIFNELLLLIDYYDLWGKVALPKRHSPEDVIKIYQMAMKSRGIFVNPALTEPFGLTLLEAASCGLPVVATKNGGARDIVERCKNGLLIDPLDIQDIGSKLIKALSSRDEWNRWSRSGLANTRMYYTWDGHVKRYIKVVKRVITRVEKKWGVGPRLNKRIVMADRILVCDIDNTLIGNMGALVRLIGLIAEAGDRVSFGVATGRSLKLALNVIKEWNVPTPNFMVTGVGSEIYYGSRMVEDIGWERSISYRWKVDTVLDVLTGLPGIKPQGQKGQSRFKVSFFLDPKKAPPLSDISRMLREVGVHANLTFSHGMYLDVLPIRASKGLAIRHLAIKWGIPVERILVAGDSGNDVDMLRGNTLGVVVGNYDPELEKLKGETNIYFAKATHADGIIEGISHYDFFGSVKSEEA
jgi:sucrose-phosphate synthase